MNASAIKLAGFQPVTRSPRRLIANIQGARKSTGKTRLALTARKPVGYISIEIGGEEGVADQFIPVGQESFDGIQIARIKMDAPVFPSTEDFKDDKAYNKAVADAMQSVASPAMDRFYESYYSSLENMATTVIDTGTDLYALARLADFGRLEQVPQLAYVQVKRAFAKLMEDAFSNKGSVLWIHHMKDKGETFVSESTGKQQWRASGNYEMDGCNVVNDKVQAVIELWREDLEVANENTGRMVKFKAMITESRHNPDAMHETFEDDFDFADIGMKIFRNSSRADWV